MKAAILLMLEWGKGSVWYCSQCRWNTVAYSCISAPLPPGIQINQRGQVATEEVLRKHCDELCCRAYACVLSMCGQRFNSSTSLKPAAMNTERAGEPIHAPKHATFLVRPFLGPQVKTTGSSPSQGDLRWNPLTGMILPPAQNPSESVWVGRIRGRLGKMKTVLFNRNKLLSTSRWHR